MTSTPHTEGRRGPAPAAAIAARARGALRGTAVRLWHDNVADSAAALTYYGLLALLPALVVAVSLVGLLGDATRQRLVSDLTSYAPPQSAQVLQDALNGLSAAHTSIWTLAFGGVVSALWSSCSYLAVFRRALHTMHRVPDTRPPLRAAHTLLITASLLLLLLVVGAVGLVASGPLAHRLATAAGVDVGSLTVLRWPVLLGVVTLLILMLFRTGPTGTRGTRRGLPGGVLAAVLWLGASLVFTLYTQLNTYGRLYGSLAGVIVFVVWLWFANLALLAGAQFNRELSRGRAG